MPGRVWKVGNNIDTDVIIPARYLNTSDPAELAKHCLEGISPDFPKKIQKGDILVAGENFGCGSSREHAPVAIKAAGIFCVIAKSFARIFYRNAINIGLPILESKEAAQSIKEGDKIKVDLKSGEVTNLSTGKIYRSQPFPEFMQKLIKAGGLIPYLKKKLETSRN